MDIEMEIGSVVFESGDVKVIVVETMPIPLSVEGIGLVGTIGGGKAFEMFAGGVSLATYHADVASVISDAEHCAAYRAKIAAAS